MVSAARRPGQGREQTGQLGAAVVPSPFDAVYRDAVESKSIAEEGSLTALEGWFSGHRSRTSNAGSFFHSIDPWWADITRASKGIAREWMVEEPEALEWDEGFRAAS